MIMALAVAPGGAETAASDPGQSPAVLPTGGFRTTEACGLTETGGAFQASAAALRSPVAGIWSWCARRGSALDPRAAARLGGKCNGDLLPPALHRSSA